MTKKELNQLNKDGSNTIAIKYNDRNHLVKLLSEIDWKVVISAYTDDEGDYLYLWKVSDKQENILNRFRSEFDAKLMDYKLPWQLRQQMERFIIESVK